MSESHPSQDAFEDAGSDTGVNEFLKLLTEDAEGPSEEEERNETPDSTDEDDGFDDEDAEEPSEHDDEEDEGSDNSDEDEDEADEGKAKRSKVELSDETEIEHEVNGEVHKFTIGKLKRLAGQEAAINQRSMELADKTKRADETTAAAGATLNYLYNRAKARADQYSDSNMLLWAQDLPQNELQALIEESKTAKADVEFFEKEITQMSRRVQAEAAQQLRQNAEAAHKILSGPVENGGIEGWSNARYQDLMGFAVSTGIPQQTVHTLTDPGAWKIIDMAYRYAKGSSALATKTTKVKPAKPGRVVKSTPDTKIQGVKPTREKEAMKSLRENGDIDSATNAFLSRMSRK